MKAITSPYQVAEIEISYKATHDRSVKISAAKFAYDVFMQMWDQSMIEIQEQFCVLFLNQNNEVLAFRLISSGTSSACVVDVNLILTLALKTRAKSIIMAHNHPSGNLTPSQHDKSITSTIKSACKLLNISLLDHLIVTSEGYYSFADEGVLNPL